MESAIAPEIAEAFPVEPDTRAESELRIDQVRLLRNIAQHIEQGGYVMSPELEETLAKEMEDRDDTDTMREYHEARARGEVRTIPWEIVREELRTARGELPY